ncbi:hypothetical protein EEJ42_15115 [Streptomyces botrytidirepellens]|uniref:Uncharacterized protein n=2 Tax=Streptomyces botrytidirepellens TaxID=2486417 RepID=A0A3M8WCC3_9ACTN|nr:hypothetical protein EEJ42_15115 [Streptomyces botrytidirepellens]
MRVYAYPDPQDAVPTTDVFEVEDHDIDRKLASDAEVRDHPEVPLTDGQRDIVVTRLGFRRTSPWVVDGDRASADVAPLTTEQ